MNWYYTIAGSHVHVRVFMNGGKCGDLCFRVEEFDAIRQSIEHNKPQVLPDKRLLHSSDLITFFNETESAQDDWKGVYPGMCIDPEICRGKSHCPRTLSCCE